MMEQSLPYAFQLQEGIGALKRDNKEEIPPVFHTHNTRTTSTSLARKIAPRGSRSDMADEPIYLSDLQLARQALSDSTAEEVVLRRVYPRIYQVARATVGRQSYVDDIAQLAAMEVVKSLGRYAGRGSLEAWAGRIACRKAMKEIKRQRKKERGMMPLFEKDFTNNETPEKLISRQRTFDGLMSKLSNIPAKRRVPLLLRLVYGYSVREVSELTDAPFNTVKDRLKTAFGELQSILDENPGLVMSMLEELP